jgi:hypothetical protein
MNKNMNMYKSMKIDVDMDMYKSLNMTRNNYST